MFLFLITVAMAAPLVLVSFISPCFFSSIYADVSSAVLRQTRILTRLFQSKAGSFLRQFFGPEPLQANQDYACLGPGNEIELH